MFLPLLYTMFAEAPPVTEGDLPSGNEPAGSDPPEQTPQQDGTITDTVQLTKEEYDNLINTNANLRNMQSSFDQVTAQVPVIQAELEELRKSKAELDVIKQQQEQIPTKTALDDYFDALPQTGNGDDDESFLSSGNGDGLAQQRRFGESIVTTVINAIMPELQQRDDKIEQINTAQTTYQEQSLSDKQTQQSMQSIEAGMDAYTKVLMNEFSIDEPTASEYRANLEHIQSLWDGVKAGTVPYDEVVKARHESMLKVLEFSKHKAKADHDARLDESRTAALAVAGAKPVVIPDLSQVAKDGEFREQNEGEQLRQYAAEMVKDRMTKRAQNQRLFEPRGG